MVELLTHKLGLYVELCNKNILEYFLFNIALIYFNIKLFLYLHLVQDIQTLYNKYISSGGKPDATSFGVWLIRNGQELLIENQIFSAIEASIPADSMVAILLGRLERFVHIESKLVLKKIGINNPDEFALMSTLYFIGKTTKTNLLKHCLFEITTGSQMLKRMKEDGYLEEKNNPEDGRSSLVELSCRGEKKLFEAFKQLNSIKGLTDGITEVEKIELSALLHKLDKIHSNRYQIGTVAQVIRNKTIEK